MQVVLVYIVFSRPYFTNGQATGMVVVICHGCIVAKWCELGPKLLLITNRKSHIGFQMT